MADLIPLSEIGALAVLTGARVPLITERVARAEWVADQIVGWRHKDDMGRETFGPLVSGIPSNWGDYALNPADPDVARLLDRRIAEALDTGQTEAPAEHATATLQFEFHPVPHFVIWWARLRYRGGQTGQMLHHHPALAGVVRNVTNIPTARAALIRALYPRKDA